MINTQSIAGLSVECDNRLISLNFSFVDENIKLSNFTNEPLIFNKNYKLKIFMENGVWYSKEFKTAGLPDITDNGQFRVIKVPAMPEKGFNYPYYLTLPSSSFKQENLGKKRYLLVEPNNGGYVSDDLTKHDKDAYELAYSYNSHGLAEELWLPRLVPAFPRPQSLVNNQPIYTHALTRNTIFLEDLMKASGNDEKLFKDMIRVEKQLNAMMSHAIQYLNQYGYNVDSQKVFMWGFSASGDFVNRFTAMYPERVKVAMSGGHSDKVMLPLSEAGGYKLIYPLGTYDYEKITGKRFNLQAYNNVAQFIYEGELDDNDTYNAWDCFGDQENKIIRDVLGEQKYPQRWNKTKELFFKAGGKAQFVIYKGLKHETSSNGMWEDYKNFFNANRSSAKPVYIKLTRPELTINDTGGN